MYRQKVLFELCSATWEDIVLLQSRLEKVKKLTQEGMDKRLIVKIIKRECLISATEFVRIKLINGEIYILEVPLTAKVMHAGM